MLSKFLYLISGLRLTIPNPEQGTSHKILSAIGMASLYTDASLIFADITFSSSR